MKLTGNKRIRGEFDSVDLIAGLLIALCIPTLTYFVLKNTGVAKKSDPQGYLKKASKTVLAKPDSELGRRWANVSQATPNQASARAEPEPEKYN